LNHQVKSSSAIKYRLASKPHRWENPARFLRRVAADVGADRDSIGLMTAVAMKRLVIGREEREGIWVECFATVGVTNAVRAGEWPPEESPRQTSQPGTINLILITNAVLSNSALVGAVQVATESKTGVLRDCHVRSWTGETGATGTGTDAVVVASGLQGVKLAYSGTHTRLGAMIGRVVSACVKQGLLRSRRRTMRSGNRTQARSTQDSHAITI
jgi:iron complex transport system ATP-binding protein